MIIPNEAQEKALRMVNESNNNKGMVELPSGVGKTIFSALLTKDFKGSILYIVHRNKILEQAGEEFKRVYPNLSNDDIGFFHGKSKDTDKRIIFANINTLQRHLDCFKPEQFEYIIYDEYHHTGSASYQKVIKYFKPEKLIGMTATPYRMDKKDILRDVDNNVYYSMSLSEAIAKNLLVSFEYYGLYDSVDYSTINWNGLKYDKNDLNKLLFIDTRDDEIIRQAQKILGNRKTIGFCCSIEHVERMTQKFNDAGLSACAVASGLKDISDNEYDFKYGKTQYLFCCDMYNEGIDIPDCSAILFLRPTFSKRVWMQQLGRGLRKAKGKDNLVVLDFVGNYKNAYRTFEWLIQITDGVRKFRNKREKLDLYIPKIYFTRRVLDIFRMQTILSKDDIRMIIKEFYIDEGRVPRIDEIKFPIEHCFRTYNECLQYCGLIKFKG